MKVKVKSLSCVQLFVTPWTIYSPPVSSVHGIFQARILEWVAISFSRDHPDPGIEPRSPALQADSLPSEPPGKPQYYIYIYYTPYVCACMLSYFSRVHSVQPYKLYPARLLCPWDSPGKNTGVIAMPSSRGSSRPMDRTLISYISCIGRWVLYQ